MAGEREPSAVTKAKNIAWDAAKRLYGKHKDTWNVAWRMRFFKWLKWELKMDEVGKDGRISSDAGYVEPATKIMETAAKARNDEQVQEAATMTLLGENKLAQLIGEVEILQLDDSHEPRDGERLLAAQIINSGLEPEEIDGVHELGMAMEELLIGAGKKLTVVYEYQQLAGLSQGVGQELVILSMSRGHFFNAAMFIGLNEVDWLPPVLGKKVEVLMKPNGQIVYKTGMEPRVISSNLRELLIGGAYPDPIEATKAVLDGEFSFKVWQKMIKVISGYRNNPKEAPDVGFVTLSRQGAGETTMVPVPRVGENVTAVMRFIRTVNAANKIMVDYEQDEDFQEWLPLDPEGLEEKAEQEIRLGMLEIPRIPVVMDLVAKMKEKRAESSITARETTLRQKMEIDNNISTQQNDLEQLKNNFPKKVRIFEIIDKNPEKLMADPGWVNQYLETGSELEAEEIQQGAEAVIRLALQRVKLKGNLEWITRRYGINIDDASILGGDDPLARAKELVTDNEIGEEILKGIVKIIKEKVPVKDFRRVLGVIYEVAWIRTEQARTVEFITNLK